MKIKNFEQYFTAMQTLEQGYGDKKEIKAAIDEYCKKNTNRSNSLKVRNKVKKHVLKHMSKDELLSEFKYQKVDISTFCEMMYNAPNFLFEWYTISEFLDGLNIRNSKPYTYHQSADFYKTLIFKEIRDLM